MIRVPIPLIAAALVLTAIGATAAATEPSGAPARSLPVSAGGGSGPVVRESFVCPDLMTVPNTLTTTVAVATADSSGGSATLSAAQGSNRQAVPLIGVAKPRALYDGPLTGPVTIEAQGALTGSFVADQVARGSDTSVRGLSEVRCEPPVTDQWFVGAATMPGDTPVLVLVNPTDSQAVVDVTVLTPSGRSQASAGSNLLLAAHTVQRIAVASLAPNARVTAVHVTATTGRVSAAVHDVRTSGLTYLGTDWVPQSAPATTVTLAGLPGTVSGALLRRVVYVTAPGETDATVSIKVTTPAGTFVPVGFGAVPVLAGTVRALDLTKPLGDQPALVTVTSEDSRVPIVATALIDAASTKGFAIHEITYLGPASALRRPALIPFISTAGDTDSVLVLSAPAQAGTVTIIVSPPNGAVQRIRVQIAAGSTIARSLQEAKVPDKCLVTVIPDSASVGTIYAVRLIEENGSRGPLLSAFTLLGAQPLETFRRSFAGRWGGTEC